MTLKIRPIEVTPGVEPITENTNQATTHYVMSDKIRFVNGVPEKIGGWDTLSTVGSSLSGVARSVFSYILDGRVRLIIGTNSRLIYIDGTTATNITPLQTSTNAIANSLDSYYKTLANNAISTTSGTNVVTISDTSTKIRVQDTVVISGVSGSVGGIPDTELNGTHFVRSQSTNSFTIQVTSTASSTTSGGGASIVLASGVVTVNATAHGQSDGDRVKITDASTFAGLDAVEINKEFLIRNVTTNAFDVRINDIASSSVTGGGGASTKYQKQIEPGNIDATVGSGYGLGLYGEGLYGVAKTAYSSTFLPRIWSFDRFGDLVIMSPGNDGAVYSWNSDVSAAPVVVSGSPTANYVFETDTMAVTLGADSTENLVQWCSVGALTTWTPASTNTAGDLEIRGAGRLITAASARGTNLLFTENQVYSMTRVQNAQVFAFQKIDDIGIIAQNARISINGVVYWMGLDNFYMYRGGTVEVIPSNTRSETTLKKYVFDNINYEQSSKIFAWNNVKFNEIWWHYPSSTSNEPDRIVRFNYNDFTWTPDTLERTAAEYPLPLLTFPILLNSTGSIFRHENGTDDHNAALPFTLTTRYFYTGTLTQDVGGIIPDSLQTGDIDLSINLKKYPQSQDITEKTSYTITPTTERVPFFSNGRFYQYVISGSELGQSWRGGIWLEEYQESTRR